jgi:hypothetical protein
MPIVAALTVLAVQSERPHRLHSNRATFRVAVPGACRHRSRPATAAWASITPTSRRAASKPHSAVNQPPSHAPASAGFGGLLTSHPLRSSFRISILGHERTLRDLEPH